jgi:hypothetical protein
MVDEAERQLGGSRERTYPDVLSPLTGPPIGQDYRYQVVPLRDRARYALT